MTDSDADPGFVPVYRVRLQPSDGAHLRYAPGSESPVQLVLTLRDHLSLASARQISTRGAILELDMKKEIALDIYKQIGNLALTMDWPLPKLERNQA
jgi:hypothetical protein